MPNALKVAIAKLARNLGYELKRWRPPTQTEQDRDDALLNVHALLQRNQITVNTIFDVGANQGEYCARALEFFSSATVYCFEPTPNVFAHLKQRFADNARVKLEQLAISDSETSIAFHTRSDAAWNSILTNGAGGVTPSAQQTIQVQAITLDQFAERNAVPAIDLLKLDIQGAEMLALQGAEKLLTTGQIKVVQMEINFARLYQGQADFETVSRMMFQKGFWLQGIYEVVMGNGLMRAADIVFAHSSIASAA